MKKLKLTTIFRMETLFLLRKKPMSGYEISKEIEALTGEKPSSGKVYPYLKELRDARYIIEIESSQSNERARSKYKLSDKGEELVVDLINRMSNLVDIQLTGKFDTCFHCGVHVQDSNVFVEGSDGNKMFFCCKHCMNSFSQTMKN